jgi:hypothetical protein
LNQQEIKKLRELAQAAGSERWEHSDGEDIVFGPSGDSVCICHGNFGHMPDPIYPDQRAAFIAAADPDAILELIEHAEKAEAELKAIAEKQAADTEKLKEALEIGRDAAHEVAQRFHEEMKGYREAEHKQVDADVATIEAAIASLSPAQQEPDREDRRHHEEPDDPNHPGHHDGHTCEAMGQMLADFGSQRTTPEEVVAGMHAKRAASATDADRPCECFGGQARCKAPSPCPAQATPEGYPALRDLPKHLREKVKRGTHPNFQVSVMDAADEIDRLRAALISNNTLLKAATAEMEAMERERDEARAALAASR